MGINMDTDLKTNHRPSARTLLTVALILLSHHLCPTEANYYSILSEGGKTTFSFPEAPKLKYHERLAFAGQPLLRDAETWLARGIPDDVADGLTELLQGIEDLHRFSSNAQNSYSHSSAANGVQAESDAEADEGMLNVVMASLDSVADTRAVSSRCINDTGFLLVNMVRRQGWALKFLDAAGKPGPGISEFRLNFVGDYDLCRDQSVSNGTAEFRGNYVIWKIALHVSCQNTFSVKTSV
ncbi:nose resistant to fluoxetine protein 6-like Protein [Elysia marginata]|uniref:Nose resistant to fluoxetine protein 6-like Protein n=1 Tax=Elysia marginata TaxID=1093978 RepID=A0AAV4GRD3_9GAST|nr:nose resistant to fluoxetine protein 6-like Protein [Elysia marginata]